MSRRAIAYIGRKSSGRPYAALLIVVLLTALAGWAAATRLRVRMDVADLLPPDSQVARATRLADWDFGGYDYLLCVLEVKDDAPPEIREDPAAFFLDVVGEVEYALDDQRYFRRRTDRLRPREVLGIAGNDAALISVLTDKDFDQIESRVFPDKVPASVAQLAADFSDSPTTETLQRLQRDPFGMEQVLASRSVILAGPLKENFKDGSYLSSDGRMMLLLLWPVNPSTDLLKARELLTFLEETREGLYQRNSGWRSAVNIDFTGPHIENAAGAGDISRDIFNTSLVSFLSVLVLFFVAFRQPEALLFVAIPLVVGVVWTLGLASLFVDSISQVTLAFAAILIGLAIDFSIHLYNRYVEDLRSGASVEDALSEAITHTGPAIVAGAITTGFAFFGMMLTRFRGFQQLGLFGGIGIILCLIAVAMTLPPLMILFAKSSMKSRRALATFGLKKVSFTVESYPRLTVAASLSILVFLGIHATTAGFDPGFTSLRQLPESYVQLQKRLRAHFQLPMNQVLVITEDPDLNRVLENNDQVFRNIESMHSLYRFVTVDSLRTIYPSPKTQKQNLERVLGWRLDRISTELRASALTATALPPDFFDPFIERLGAIQKECAEALSARDTQISRESVGDRIFTEIVRSYMTLDAQTNRYRILTRVYPPQEPEWAQEVPPLFIEKIATDLAEPPTVLGNAMLNSELQWVVIKDLTRVVLIVFFSVIIYLAFYFKSFARAALAMVPVVYAMLSMLGLMTLFGVRLNYLNVIAIPMVVGIGVDNAIHLLGRFYERESHNMRLAIERTGRAIVITGLTTIFGFGALSVASFQSVREIGFLSIMGAVASLFASLVFLPAILKLLDPRYTYSGGSGDEIG